MAWHIHPSWKNRIRNKVLRSILRDCCGNTMVEFALVSPAFIALLLAITETALVFFAQEALETGAEASARSIITGQAQMKDATGAATGMTAAQLQERFRTTACAALPAFMTCSNVMIDVQSYSGFSAASTAPPTITYNGAGNITNSWNYNLGSAGSIVVVRLMYLWPVPPGPLGFNLGNLQAGKRLLLASSVAKSEPYL
jgi:Flp pilus assembly protein TadG